jgi:hypothetical protein
MRSTSLTSTQLREFALRGLGLLSSPEVDMAQVTDGEVAAESVRCALWALTYDGQDPVYVTRCLNFARRLAQPAFSPQTQEQDDSDLLLRDAMEDLESLGDIATLHQGYRLPAPVRVVPLSSATQPCENWLLIGGLPSHQFPKKVQPFFFHRGAARIWTRDPRLLVEEMGVVLPTQSESLWRCEPTSTSTQLQDWARQVLARAVLSPLENYEAEFEAYVPGSLAEGTGFPHGDHPFQFKRWTTDFPRLRDGRYLMRRHSRFGMAEARVGHLQDGKLRATAPLDKDNKDVRRLLYGLDSLNHSPTIIQTKRMDEGTLFRLRNEVPRSQNRLLLALGKLCPNTAQNSYYPRDWLVASAHERVIGAALQALGVHLEEAKWL